MKWLLGIALLLVAGWVLKLSLLVYAMYVLLAVMLLARTLSGLWHSALQARRSGGTGTFEIGESVSLQVHVENRGTLTIQWLLLEDSVPAEIAPAHGPRIHTTGTRLAVQRLRPGDTISLDYSATFLKRGYYVFGPILAETGDVFGLHRRFRLLTEPATATVVPKVIPLRGYSLASRRPLGEIRVVHRLFEDPTRLAGLRPYQQGDSVKRIHWRATARTGELHSRVYENSRVAGAVFLLDFAVSSYPGTHAVGSAELAVISVASLANAVSLKQQQIGFITNGRDAAERVRATGPDLNFSTRKEARARAAPASNERLRPLVLPARKGADSFSQLLEVLGRIELNDGLSFAELIRETASQIPRDATVIAVLHHVSDESSAQLVQLARQGFNVFAIVAAFDGTKVPDWAHPPEWADNLLAQGIDFRVACSEEDIADLCAEALTR